MSKVKLDAPSWPDVQMMALNLGYAVRIDREGFHVRNVNTGATRIVGTIADLIDIVTRRSL